MLKSRVFEAFAWDESVTVIGTVTPVTACWGIPLMTPWALSVVAEGNAFGGVDQVYGGVPPLACSLKFFACPTVKPSKLSLSIDKGVVLVIFTRPLLLIMFVCGLVLEPKGL